jgi:hypothetical protein
MKKGIYQILKSVSSASQCIHKKLLVVNGRKPTQTQFCKKRKSNSSHPRNSKGENCVILKELDVGV